MGASTQARPGSVVAYRDGNTLGFGVVGGDGPTHIRHWELDLGASAGVIWERGRWRFGGGGDVVAVVGAGDHEFVDHSRLVATDGGQRAVDVIDGDRGLTVSESRGPASRVQSPQPYPSCSPYTRPMEREVTRNTGGQSTVIGNRWSVISFQ